MTQEELKLVLEALKWCHGGEPCGTAEAIAVVEKALANVATNDTSKEYVDEMQKQRHEQEPVATVDNNSQKWAEMDGAIAFHLIERHADGWNDIRKMMGEWLSANTPQRTWVGLTNDELTDLFYNTNLGQQSAVAQAIALLKERNT
jgi:hypothetical protein